MYIYIIYMHKCIHIFYIPILYIHIHIHIYLYIYIYIYAGHMFCIINLQGHSSLSQFIILDLNVDKDVSCF